MLVHVHIRLTTKDLEQLRQKIGFIPDRAVVRAWARERILEDLKAPGEIRAIADRIRPLEKTNGRGAPDAA